MKKYLPQILRLSISLVFALIVTGFTLYAAWNQQVNQSFYRHTTTLYRTIGLIEEYREKHHRIPHKLSDLKEDERYKIWAKSDGGDVNTLDDYWHRPLAYQTDGSKYVITSYGRDGKPGGEGLDLDVSSDNPEPRAKAITFFQFFSVPESDMAQWGLLSGVLVFILAWLTVRPTALKKENIIGLLLGLVFLGFVLTFVTTFITLLHVPSGH